MIDGCTDDSSVTGVAAVGAAVAAVGNTIPAARASFCPRMSATE